MKIPKYIADLIKQRDAALISLDKEQILAYMRAYDIPIPPDEVFWLGVHKARSAATSLPPAVRAESAVWLRAHGSRGFFLAPVTLSKSK